MRCCFLPYSREGVGGASLLLLYIDRGWGVRRCCLRCSKGVGGASLLLDVQKQQQQHGAKKAPERKYQQHDRAFIGHQPCSGKKKENMYERLYSTYDGFAQFKKAPLHTVKPKDPTYSVCIDCPVYFF